MTTSDYAENFTGRAELCSSGLSYYATDSRSEYAFSDTVRERDLRTRVKISLHNFRMEYLPAVMLPAQERRIMRLISRHKRAAVSIPLGVVAAIYALPLAVEEFMLLPAGLSVLIGTIAGAVGGHFVMTPITRIAQHKNLTALDEETIKRLVEGWKK